MDLNEAQGCWLSEQGLCQLDVINWALTQVGTQPGSDLVEVLIGRGYISKELGLRARKEGNFLARLNSPKAQPNPIVDSESKYAHSQSDFTATVGLDAAKSDSLQFDPMSRKVGPFSLGEELGRGGMGVVYLATHDTLKRTVALKMLLAGPENSRALQRFEIEASAMARLRHPNIIEVFDVALGKELAYVAMEYVEGPTLKEKLDDSGVTVTEALEIAEKLGHALHHAHCQNIIHRDMKPANVLLRQGKEPILTDFGLAKALDENTGLSQTGTLQGTPAYMSPEQVEGKHARIDGRADVYSLGVTLFEMLMGELPFEGRNVQEVITKICLNDAPRARGKGIPKSVTTIVERCLAKEACDRYETAEDFAEDCRRVLDNKPIHARPVGVFERFQLWRKRNRVFVAVIFLLFGLSLLLGFEYDRQEKKEALQAAKREAAKLIESERAAQAAKARDRRRFDQVRTLVHSLVFEVSDALENIPGTAKARKLLLLRGIEYLNAITREAKDDPALERELALAYVRVGRFQSSRHGGLAVDKVGAYRSFNKALEILESQKDRSSPEFLHALSLAKVQLANLHFSEGRNEPAEKILDQGISLLKSLVFENRQHGKGYVNYAAAIQIKVMIEKDRGRLELAFDLLDESQQILEQGKSYCRDFLSYYECSANNYLLRSQIFESQKDVKTAESNALKGVKVLQSVQDKFKQRSSFVRHFMVLLREHARLTLATGKYDSTQRALRTIGQLTGNSYDTKKYNETRREVIKMIKEGEQWISEKELKRGIPLLQRALRKQRESVVHCQGQPESFLTLSVIHRKIGEALINTKSVAICTTQLNHSEAILFMLLKRTAGDKTPYELNYAMTLECQFKLYAKLGDLKKAQGILEKFRAYAKRKNYQNIDPRSLVAFGSNFHRMAALFLERKKHDSALFWFEKSAILWGRLKPEIANRNKSFPGSLGVLGCHLGTHFFEAKKTEQSRKCFLISQKVYDVLLAESPNKISFLNNQMLSYHHLGLMSEQSGNKGEALNYFQKERKLAVKIRDLKPSSRIGKIIKQIEVKIKALGG